MRGLLTRRESAVHAAIETNAESLLGHFLHVYGAPHSAYVSALIAQCLDNLAQGGSGARSRSAVVALAALGRCVPTTLTTIVERLHGSFICLFDGRMTEVDL